MAPRQVDPAIHRNRLRVQLRRAREDARLTQRQAASAVEWSLSKLIRIEAGVVSVSVSDLRALLTTYLVTEHHEVDSLLATARAARQPSAWNAYSDVASPDLISYLAYEAEASVIRGYEPFTVPGLLQTPDYARAVISQTWMMKPSGKKIEDLLELRLARQEILEGHSRPRLQFIMDEAVIRRTVGDRTIMRSQLRYLLELAQSDRVSILIVPFHAGVYSLLTWPTIFLEFDDPGEEAVLFIEHPREDVLLRESDRNIQGLGRLATYLEEFWHVGDLALDQSAGAMINDAIATLDRAEGRPTSPT